MAQIERTGMTAAEFLALPETMERIELIEGEIVVSPAAKDPHQRLIPKIIIYLARLITTGEFRVAPTDVYLDDTVVLQPDIFWVSGDESRCALGDDGYWHGAPDLVIEIISPSTAARDRGVKYELYQRYGVREFWLVEPAARFVEVYVLHDGVFRRGGVFGVGQSFVSAPLGDVTVSVAALLGD